MFLSTGWLERIGVLPQSRRKPSLRRAANVLAIGDSHACFWSGEDKLDGLGLIPSLVPIRLGPATAHNLVERVSSVNARARLFDYIQTHGHRFDVIMLSFGEIDCRGPLIKSALGRGVSIEQAVAETVARYASFARDVVDRFSKPCVYWGPPASSDPKRSFNPDYPMIGTMLERNFATRVMNDALRRDAATHPMLSYVSLFDVLVDPEMQSIGHLFWDGCHVSTSLLPLALQRLDKAISKFRLRLAINTKPSLLKTPHEIELRSDDAKWRVESRAIQHSHRNREIFDIGSAYFLKSVSFRLKAAPECKPTVELSLDSNVFQGVDLSCGEEGEVVVSLRGDILTRFISISSNKMSPYEAGSLRVKFNSFQR